MLAQDSLNVLDVIGREDASYTESKNRRIQEQLVDCAPTSIPPDSKRQPRALDTGAFVAV